ncbi:MAG: proline--tRNA ligase [Nanoarchaeota archaeon]|nr:proline--tRNA ligase [Nanoarchaeota archaeon]
MAKEKTQGITIGKKNFSEWYEQVILKCGLVDKRLEHSRGFYGYPPWGAKILGEIENLFEKELIDKNHLPIRTPTAIPITLLEKEKEHATGFAPEVFLITKGHGGKELDIPKVLRPTGEAAIYPYFSYWIQTYKDLPFKIFETRPSFRAERTNAIFPLLRTAEFYWIEAHTAQLTNEDADKQVKEDMSIFKRVVEEELAIPFMLFKRPEWDKFAGADYTCAYDSPLPDGKVSQIGTTHNLGMNFSKPFNVTYVDKENKKQFCYQTSFGMGVSKILGMIAAIHGDDFGLVLPPKVAPIQIIIVPIYYKDEDKEKVLKLAKKVKLKLKQFRIEIDSRDDYTPGWKFNEWEMKGVPFRFEIGPKDVEKNQVVLVRRIDRKKEFISIDELSSKLIEKKFEELTELMFERAKKGFKKSKAKNFEDILKKINAGVHLVEIPFCNSEKCVNKLKEQTIKVRGILLFANGENTVSECVKNSRKAAEGKKCAVCGKPAKEIVWVARQY